MYELVPDNSKGLEPCTVKAAFPLIEDKEDQISTLGVPWTWVVSNAALVSKTNLAGAPPVRNLIAPIGSLLPLGASLYPVF